MIHGKVAPNILSTVMQDYNDNLAYLSRQDDCHRVHGMEFYQQVFGECQRYGEPSAPGEFTSNPIFQYTKRKRTDENLLVTRIMFEDTWPNDYKVFIDRNPGTLCSGLSYLGRRNTLDKARQLHAFIFDLDSVGVQQLNILYQRFGAKAIYPGAVPRPTFLVMSGGGLHLYYVLDTPLQMFPNIKLEAKRLKYALTDRIWHYGETTRLRQVQYQSIAQSYRMPGSLNSKYNLEVLAFKVGPRISIDELNAYVKVDNRVLGEKAYWEHMPKSKRPKKPLEYWMDADPEWYERRIIKGDQSRRTWHTNRAFYDHFLGRFGEVQGGHRYFYMMSLVIIAVKCGIEEDELKRDLHRIYKKLQGVEHTNELTEEDIEAALEVYDPAYSFFPRAEIERRSGIQFKHNVRNGRTRAAHLRRARFSCEEGYRERGLDPGEWRNKDGAPTMDHLVRDWRAANPNCSNKSKCARETGLSRPTVHKWWDACAPN